MSYFTSNNTLNLVILIVIIVVLLLMFTDVKKVEIFTDTSSTTTTEGGTTTTESGTTTTNSETTTTKYNFSKLIDQNIAEGKDRVKQGKEYLDSINDDNELEKCSSY